MTSAHIVGVQIFADNTLSIFLLWTHPLKNFSLDKALKVKVGFEQIAATIDTINKYYRADNSCFSNDRFIKASITCY